MDHMAEIRVTFFQECEEQLAALEAGLLTMQEGDTSLETVNAVFRAVHSIKGGAGAFKLDRLVGFAHVFETVLDLVRGGTLSPDAEVMRVMLRAADVLADLVADARDGHETDPASFAAVAAELQAILDSSGAPEADDDVPDFAPVMIAFDDLDQPPPGPVQAVHVVRFAPHASLFAKANEPLALLRELRQLGTAEVICDATALPDLASLDPAQSYLAWTVMVETTQDEAAIREVFEFVEGDCDVAISQAGASDTAQPTGGIVPPAPAATADVPAPRTAEAQEEAAAPSPPDRKSPERVAVQPTIRVDLERVDRLINLVGELVINQAMLSQRVNQSGHARDGHVTTSLDELEHLTRDLQESVMAIRAQPVRPLFQRMSRIVREVADATGKQVRLRTEGEQTEIDKTVLELLADPLTHMIRNAVDHGIEKPEARLSAKKPLEGTVRLSAAHRSGRVIIEVADDGGGLNRPRILESAIRKGLVAPDAVLSESEIDNLLFMPGCSTAATISNISGRGVGMDVVKRSIQDLGGRITISSRLGEGSAFTMSLPLTLAVLDGIIVSIGNETFVIPLTAIVETLKLEPHWIHMMGEGTSVLHVRDRFVPLVDVGLELGVRSMVNPRDGGVAILVETEKGSRSALLVDGIQDQRQVVIKSLETNYDRVRGVAAATILGDGRVAMILDVDGLVGTRTSDSLMPDAFGMGSFNYARAS